MSRTKSVLLAILLMTALSEPAWSATIARTLDWQLPQLNNGKNKLRLQFYSQPTLISEIETQEANSVVITSDQYQQLVVCARDVQIESESAVPHLLTALTDNSWLLVTQGELTCLKLFDSQPCDPQRRAQYGYSSRQLLLSDKPFLVRYHSVNNAKKYCLNSISGDDDLVLTGLPATNSDSVITVGGGHGLDDDSQHKRPHWIPFPASNAFTLTLLPNLKLPEGLGDYLPDLRTWYHLLDSTTHSEGQTLLLRYQGHPSLPIAINRYEQQELAQHLTSIQQLLGWLVPKLNGRAMLAELLLDWQQASSDSSAILQETTLHAIQAQLADILEQPDSTFNLEIELNQLGNSQGKATPALTGDKSSGNHRTISNSQKNTGKGKSDETEEQQWIDISEEPSDKSLMQNLSTLGTPLTISLIGRFDAGKSSLGNGLLEYQHFPVKEIRNDEEEKTLLYTN